MAYTDADSYIAMSNDERLDKLLIKDEDDKENKNVKSCKNDSNERKRSNEEVDEIDKVEPPKKKSRKKNVIQSDSGNIYVVANLPVMFKYVVLTKLLSVVAEIP